MIPLPTYIKHWINSIPLPICTLVDELDDLADGRVIFALVEHVFKIECIPNSNGCEDAYSRLKCTISYLADTLGWSKLPGPLKSPAALKRFSEQGDLNILLIIAKLLFQVKNAPSLASQDQEITQDSLEQKENSKPTNIQSQEMQNESQNKQPSSSMSTLFSRRKSRSPDIRAINTIPLPAQPETNESTKVTTETPRVVTKQRIEVQHARCRSPSPTLRRTTSPVCLLPASYQRHARCHDTSPSICSDSRSDTRVNTSSGDKQNQSANMLRFQKYLNRKSLNHLDISKSPTLETQTEILIWLQSIGVDYSYRSNYLSSLSDFIYHKQHSKVNTSDKGRIIPSAPLLDLSDEWSTGVFLSVVVAASILRNDKVHLKEVEYPNTGFSKNGKRRLLLVGTEVNVKSPAQVMRNYRVCIKAMQLRPPLHDIDLEAEDFIMPNNHLTWYLLEEIYKISSSRCDSATRSKSPNRLSPVKYPTPKHGSLSQMSSPATTHDSSTDSILHDSLQTTPTKKRWQSPSAEVRSSLKKDEQRKTDSREKKMVKSKTPPKINESSRRRVSPSVSNSKSIKIKSSPNRKSPTSDSRRSPTKKSVDAKRSNSKNFKKLKFAAPLVQHLSERPEFVVPLNLPHTHKYKSRFDSPQKFSLPQSPRSVNIASPHTSNRSNTAPPRVSDTFQAYSPKKYSVYDKRRHRISELGLRNARRSQSVTAEKWFPPASGQANSSTPYQKFLLPVTNAQISAVRQWLLDLNISPLREGEGGVSTGISSNPIDPLKLFDDRIRNGVILYELLCLLEPRVATKANLSKIIYLRPTTVMHVLDNLERVLWLWNICKSPPIPQILLVQPQEILRGNKQIIWSLLFELMLTYRSQPLGSQAKNNSIVNNDNEIQRKGSYRNLAYSIRDRRLLDLSLMAWLTEVGVLQRVMPSVETTKNPKLSTILAYEKHFRDGTLFCHLIYSEAFTSFGVSSNLLDGSPSATSPRKQIMIPNYSWYRCPKTFQQCVSNLSMVTGCLRNLVDMPRRYLYHGIEEEIVRGHWDGVLGLLEDMHKYSDLIRDGDMSESKISTDDSKPYLGKNFQPTFAEQPSFREALQEWLIDPPPISTPISKPAALNKPTTDLKNDLDFPTAFSRLETLDGGYDPTYVVDGSTNVALNQSTNQDFEFDMQDIYRSNIDLIPRPSSQISKDPTPGFRLADSLPEKFRESEPQGFTLDSLTQEDSPLRVPQSDILTSPTEGIGLGKSSLQLESDAKSLHFHDARYYSALNNVKNNRDTIRPSTRSPSPGRLRVIASSARYGTDPSPSWRDTRSSSRRSSRNNEPKGRSNNISYDESLSVDATNSSGSNSGLGNDASFADSLDRTQTPSKSPYRRASPSKNHAKYQLAEKSKAELLNSMQGDPGSAALELHRMKKAMRIDRWVESLGIQAPSVSILLSNSKNDKNAFSDGAKLCEIAMKSSRMNAMPGVTWSPHTQAQKLQNIRKFLEYVKITLKDMRTSDLTIDESILSGDAGVTLLHILDRLRATSLTGRYTPTHR